MLPQFLAPTASLPPLQPVLFLTPSVPPSCRAIGGALSAPPPSFVAHPLRRDSLPTALTGKLTCPLRSLCARYRTTLDPFRCFHVPASPSVPRVAPCTRHPHAARPPPRSGRGQSWLDPIWTPRLRARSSAAVGSRGASRSKVLARFLIDYVPETL